MARLFTKRLLVILAVLHSVGAQYCLSGYHQIRCQSVLIVHSANISNAEDVQAKLRATNAFNTVDTLDAAYGAPTLSRLNAYDAVLLFNDRLFSNGTIIGDLLAAYHDNGGGVVAVGLSREQGRNRTFMGAFGTPGNGYTVLDYLTGDLISPPDSLGELLEPASPLLTGVYSLAALLAHRSTAPVINGGIVVARWRNGGQEPLVVRGVRGNRTLVALNFFPASSSVDPALWTGDGAALMRNALKYSRCMTCWAGTYSVAGEHRWRLGR
jgi:hypothetical protein